MKKSVITLLIFLIMIICVSAVSAADDANDDLAASDEDAVSVSNDDIVSASDSNTVLTASEPNFKDLQGNITGQTGTIELKSSYKRNDSETNSITFDNDLTIEGKGLTIDNSGKTMAIFTIGANQNVILSNMHLVNATLAVQNFGNLTLRNVDFIGCKIVSEANSKLTISGTGCSFDDGDIELKTDSQLLSQATVIVTSTPANIVLPETQSTLSAQAIVGGKRITVPTSWKFKNESGNIGTGQDIVFAPNKVGTYVINATNDVITNAVYQTATISVNAGKSLQSVITIDKPTNAVYNDTIVFKVTIANKTTTEFGKITPTGEIYYNISSSGVTILEGRKALVNGTANITMEKSKVGRYMIQVEYDGDLNFESNSNDAYIQVYSKTPDIIITVDNSTFGEQKIDVTLPSDIDASSTITLIVNDTVEDTTHLTDGKASFTIHKAVGKNYNVTIVYDGPAGSYVAYATNTTFFDVNKVDTTVIITGTNVTYGENLTFTVQLASDINDENVTVTVNGDDKGNYTLTNGYALVDLGKLVANQYTIVVSYAGNDVKYNRNDNQTVLRVSGEEPDISLVIGNSVLLFKDLNVTVTIANNHTAEPGEVAILVNGVQLGLADYNTTTGVYNYTIKSLAVDYKNVTAKFTPKGDEAKYLSEGNVTQTITVAKITPVITVELGKVELGVEAKGKINLTNNGTGIYAPTGKLTIRLNDYTFHQNLANGQIDLSILGSYINSVGQQTLYVNYEGDKNYTDASTEYRFNVVGHDVNITIDVDAKTEVISNVTINVTAKTNFDFTGEFNVAIENSTGVVKEFTVTLNKDVKATIFDSKLPLDTYKVTVTFAGSSSFSANSTKKNFEVIKANPSLEINLTGDVDYPTQAVVNISSSVAGKYTIYANGTKVANGTLQAGVVKGVTLDLLEVGKYEINFTYVDENNVYATTTITAQDKLTVNNGTIASLNVTAGPVNYPGAAFVYVNASVAGNYYVTVNNKNYTVEIVTPGQAVPVPIDVLDVNVYDVNVTSNITNYNIQKNSTTLTVNNGTIASLNVTVEDVVYGTNATVHIQASQDGNYTVKIGTNPTIYTVTVTGGTGEVTVGKYDVGQYGVTVESNITNYNTKTNNTVTFNVTNATIGVNVTVDNVVYPGIATVFVNATVQGTYNVTIDGGSAIYSVAVTTLKDGVYTGNASLILLAAGEHYVNVTATITNYAAVNKKQTFEVEKGTILFNVTVADVDYPNNATIVFKTNVKATNQTKGYVISLFKDGVLIKELTPVLESGSIILDVLAPGTYNVTVTATNDEGLANYTTGVTNKTTFTVNPGKIAVEVTADTVVYPNKAVIKVSANVTDTYTVTVNGKDYSVFVNKTAGGENTTTIDLLDVGEYTVNVTSNNANYTKATNNTTLKVENGTIAVSIAVDNVVYPNMAVATVTANVTGDYTITVNGKEYPVHIDAGNTVKVNIADNVLYPSGSPYAANISATIPNYKSVKNSTTFTVTSGKINLTISVANVVYGNKPIAVVSANATGTYNVTFKGKSYLVEIVSNGAMTSNTTVLNEILAVDTYTNEVEVKSMDGNYTGVSAKASFSVTKADPVINITVKNATFHDNCTIYVEIANATNGKLDFYNNGEIINKGGQISLVDGKANFTIYNIPVDDYNIKVSFTGDNNLSNANKFYAFPVKPAQSDLIIVGGECTYTENSIINITVIPNNGTDYEANGRVVITGDNIAYPATALVTGAKVSIDLGKLAGGTYNINVTYYGNANYTSVIVPYTFTVKQAKPVLDMNATGATYPGNATVNFTNNVAGNITIICAGESGSKTFDLGLLEANDWTYNITGLDAGTYTVFVKYNANQNYTQEMVNRTITILQSVPEIDAIVVSATYPDNATVRVKSNVNGTYTIVVFDQNNVTVDTQKGEFVAGEYVNVTLSVIAAGNYKVNVTYDENNDYKAVTIPRDLTIGKGTPEINFTIENSVYPNNVTGNITSSVPGNFSLTIGNYTVNGTFTVDKLTLPVNFFEDAGTYDITLVYKENENYKNVTKTGSVTIEKGTPVINITVSTETIFENAILTIEVPYATGNVTLDGTGLANPVVLNLTDGVATYSIGILEPGSYYYTVKYAGDNNFKSGENTTRFKVDKLDVNLTIASQNYTWGETGIVNITLADKNNATAIVDIYINNKLVSAFTISNGSGQYTIPELIAGTYNIRVDYRESTYYYADSKNLTVTVSQFTPTIIVPDVNVTYPETASFVISTDITNAELFVYIDDVFARVTTDNDGNATVTIPRVLDANVYTITASYAGNENITQATGTGTLTVNKGKINLDVTGPASVTYPDQVVFTITTDVTTEYTIDVNGKATLINITNAGLDYPVSADAGNCTIIVTSADDNYETATANFTTTVLQGSIDITIDAPATKFGEQYKVTVITNVSGEYLITIDGVYNISASIKTGESGYYVYSVPVQFLPELFAGNHTVTVISLDPNYDAKETQTLVINRGTTTVNITNLTNPVMVGDDVTFTVTMGDNFASGNVTIYVDGNETQTVILDSQYANATVTLSGLVDGYHDIIVKYNGNDNYEPSEGYAYVIVDKYDPVITIKVENETSLVAMALANVEISVSGAKGNATGKIFINYGEYGEQNLTDGAYLLVLTDLGAGAYDFVVLYEGDENYNVATAHVKFNVTKGTATVNITNVTTPVKFGDDVTFIVTMSDNAANGKVTLIINGAEKGIIVLDDDYANATVTLSGLTPNEYNIAVKYNGNDNFLPSDEAKTSVKVEQATPTIDIVVDEDMYALGATTVVVTVADGEATGDVKITAAGFTNETVLVNGVATLEIYDLVAGDYIVEVTYYGDYNYTKATANKTFTVAKRNVTPVISEPTSVIFVGNNATFIVTMDSDLTAYSNITVIVDNNFTYQLTLNQFGNVSVYVPNLPAGTHVIGVKYNGNDNCNPSEVVNTNIVVNKNDVSKLITVSTLDGIYGVDPAKVVIGLPADAKGNATIYIVGLDNITADITGDRTEVPMNLTLPANTYALVVIEYSGDDKYLPYTTTGYLGEFTVNKANSTVTIGNIAAATYPGSVNITYAVTPAFLDATVTVTDAKGNVIKAVVVDNKVILTDLAAGDYTITVFTPGDSNYNNATATKAFNVAKATPTFTTNASDVTVGQNVTIVVIAPTDATGTVYATVSGDLVATGIPLVNGTATIVVSGLGFGQYGYAVTYEGDNNYVSVVDINSFNVNKNDITGNVTIDIPAGASTYEPTFAIKNLPSDAEGYLIVTVDGKNYTAEVRNGAASITIRGLSAGNHNVTVAYSGDAQYGNVSKSDMITLITPVPKLSGKDLTVLYSGSAKYTVLLTIDGKPAAGEIVSVSFNGAKLSVKTNSKGEATFKLNSKAKIDKYDVTAKYSTAETTNKVTIKNIIKAKNKKVKKSKTTKVKITLSKVDGKYLKGKKLKIKLNGKKYKVKTNKKGKATWKVKPSMIKKLKVGKKYKYTVSYGKDTVTKKLKIKR